MSDKKLWRKKEKHSASCTWDGRSKMVTLGIGKCRACDDIKAIRAAANESRGRFGIEKSDEYKYCKSSIKWDECTKHTNPSCACGKPVLFGGSGL